ncbi:MAG TPA: M48 family metallopeptidase [Actinomycetota bacterium]
MANALDYFTAEQVERARRYHRPLYSLLLLDLVLDFTLLALLAIGPPGDWIGTWLNGLPFWAEAVAWPALVVALGWVIGLPLSYWRGHIHEKRWGFSTQTARGWFLDRLKGLAVSEVLATGALFGFLAVAHLIPGRWPAVVVPGAAAIVLFLSFLAPLVLEPIFNRFRPLDDTAMVDDLRGMAERAGVPVRDVLVADASRRTRKENAYVSGLGKTRRVVLYDTLLTRAEPPEVRLVAAHELGHRRMRHVAWWTAIGMAGAVGAVLLLWALLEFPLMLRAIRASGPGDPKVVPFVLLVAGALQLMGMPVAAALSRRWESAADRFALEMTQDAEVFESSFRALAEANLLDVDPPRLVYLMAFTHPTPPERIASARLWASEQSRINSPNPPTTAS